MALRTSNIIDAPIDEVFSWHERPGAIRRLSPPWQPVRVVQEASSLRDGRAVLRLPGGVRWVAQHEEVRAAASIRRHPGLAAPALASPPRVRGPLPIDHQVDRCRRDPGPGIAARRDVPLSPSPAGRRPGFAANPAGSATRRDDHRRHRLLWADRHRTGRVLGDEWAQGHQARAPRGPISGGADVEPRGSRPRARSTGSTRWCTWPAPPSPVASPTSTKLSYDGVGSSRRNDWPGPWPP